MRRVDAGTTRGARHESARARQPQASGRPAAFALALACAVAMLFVLVPAAVAVAGEPQWTVTSVSRPTNFTPGDESGEDAYLVSITNTGSASSQGAVTISDELPEGISLDPGGASGEDRLLAAHNGPASADFSCSLASCTYTGVAVPDDTLTVRFPVDVSASASSVAPNTVRVSGGGAADAAVSTPTTISSTPAAFGISPGGASTALSTTQAGAHPDLTTSIAFNTVNARGALAGEPRDTIDNLPPGFAGDLPDTPTCTGAQFLQASCPTTSQVGVITLTLLGQNASRPQVEMEPLYNLDPDPGQLAKLGFAVSGVFFFEGDVSLRPDDYGLRTIFANANQYYNELDSVSLTLWGVPADPIHDPLRWKGAAHGIGEFGASVEPARAPFFTNPAACGSAPFEATFSVDSWEQPERYVDAQMPFGPIVGCDRLTMQPSLTAEVTTDTTSSPTGLDLGMSIPQTYQNPAGLATSTLKRATVTLPEGVTVNPSAGAGLGACTEAQYEQEAVQIAPGVGCPSESKLGTVKIVSPAVKEPVEGSVYLAQPYANKFGSLLALYIVARIPGRGVIVKAAGEVTADPLTGRLVTTFDDLPPLPFSTFLFSFRQGATSPLVSPATCGSFTVQAQLTPWSDPQGTPLAPQIPPFSISSGFAGGACPTGGAAPFAPQVFAGTQDNDAGSFSPFDIRITRGDGEQEITGFSSQLPPGLTADLVGVPFCSAADIALAQTKTGAQEEAEPSCPAASQIGHTLVGAGVGSVLAQTPGKIYMAGPFEGAPFSVVAITAAKVGPFDLGTVVVHLPLRIDPLTAAVSVAAGGADQIPHIIKGIVIHVRDIRVYIDRPGFTMNPTSCARLSFAATVIGSGASFTNPADDVPVSVADPFQAADCQSLAFKPSFKVSTPGRTSRAGGAGLTAKLTFPAGPQGSEANIAKVAVDLPKQLPSRLTTLQKACTAATFDANPANCPAASIVGHAKAVTPILPVALEGPAYFVSHGGEAFPSLIVVLQGYGVTIDLLGTTFISKKGITSSTFKTVPDQPVSSFELTLPEGRYSALAANGNLCKSKLKMPTTFTAQNGFVIHQATPIAVTGCVKHRAHKHSRRTRKRAERKHARQKHK